MKIGIFLVGRIGDMILSTPMYSAIKKKYPEARITVIAGRANYNLLKNNPFIENVWVFDKNPFKLIPLLFKIIFHKFDYWLDPKDHFSTESSAIARLCGAKNTVGYNRPKSHNFDFEIPSDEANHRLHYSQRVFNALIPLGMNYPKIIPKPELYEDKDFDDSIVNSYLDKTKKNLLINLSATSHTRIYNSENWIKVISRINLNKFNVILSFVENEEAIANEIQSKIADVKLFDSKSIWDVISLVKRVDYVISPDTSVIHIASAFNIPQISLFNDHKENFVRFKPTSEKSIHIMPNDSQNVNNISADEILSAFERLVN